ncbi:MAG: hypothetical protein QOJ15_4003 [Bradyrhizobium sp.]|jgi:NADPH-dependent curcumin reductase CurA|nr:hypothetical protein [Bradyrhizobium sp.]
MTANTNRQWILSIRPTGQLTGDEFSWKEAPIPKPADGQVLIRTLWLSLDPAQRIWMSRDSYKPAIPLGTVMQSFAAGQVLESRHPDFKAGDLVRGDFSWQDYVVTDGKTFGGMHKILPSVSPNLALSLFGVNGITAYFGIKDVGRAKAGETVVVSGAAGATGSIAGQIAKILGCRVVGTAGGKGKCDWPQRNRCLLRQHRWRCPQRSARTHQCQGAHRALRFDIEIQPHRPRPGELLQPDGKAWTHGGLHGTRLS